MVDVERTFAAPSAFRKLKLQRMVLSILFQKTDAEYRVVGSPWIHSDCGSLNAAFRRHQEYAGVSAVPAAWCIERERRHVAVSDYV
jgi:hypothetical protein